MLQERPFRGALVAAGLALTLAGCRSAPPGHPAAAPTTATDPVAAAPKPAPSPPEAAQPVPEPPAVPAEWRTYPSGRVPAYETRDWASFRTAATDVSFTLRYPQEWHVAASVFLDGKGRKVAELLPGPVALQPGQGCFDHPFADPSHSSSLISETGFTLGRFMGRRRVIEAPFEGAAGSGGTSRPVVDCVAAGRFAFVMAFYPTGAGDDPSTLAATVLGSLEFTPRQ